MIIETTNDSFNKDVIESSIPVIVDLWAPWCGPCHAINPIIEKLSNEYHDRVKFCKLNVDDNSLTAGKYNIMSIPTLLFFKNSKVVYTITGTVSERALKNNIDSILISVY